MQSNQTRSPSVGGRIKKMWYVHTVQYFTTYMYRTGDHVKTIKPNTEQQVLHAFSLMWTLDVVLQWNKEKQKRGEMWGSSERCTWINYTVPVRVWKYHNATHYSVQIIHATLKLHFLLLHLCVCLYHMCASVLSVLKRASDPLELKWASGGKSPNMGDRKLGPLPEQQMLLTTEPFLQPQHLLI